MNLPPTPALSRFVQRCATITGDNITVNKGDAQMVSKEYQHLLEYTVALQAQLLEERKAQEIEIVAPQW